MKKIREKAIKRYLNGESPKEIYRSLGKGKTWFFKWLKRYKLDGDSWACEHPRRPHQSPNKINQEIEQIQRREKYVPKGTSYPSLCVTQSNDLHQLDVIGPRYLKGDGRFYSINTIDAFDRRGTIYPHRRKNRMAMVSGLIRCWCMLGIPSYLQMDNLLLSRGSNRYPHSLGIIIRLCLYLGVEPIFIPIREPWRNGIIEHFQFNFDQMFF